MAPEFGKPFHQLPLIPADVLKKHRVHEPLDTRFRSAARLFQALWREDRACRSGALSARMANAANSEAASRRRQGKGVISSRPRSPHRAARDCPVGRSAR
jgi:hypothetical protein